MRLLRIIITAVAIICSVLSGHAQESEDYESLFAGGKCEEALKIINGKLDDIYITRVEDKRVPTGFITMKSAEKVDLVQLFRERKAEGFFIEENPELSKLHLYGARCYFKLKRYDKALSNFTQSLRFKKLEPMKDDVYFYEMAQVFRETDKFTAYLNFLEMAYTMNPEKYDYSLELGNALYPTAEKKRAVYHLERYVKSAEQEIDPALLLKLGNLHEDTGRYLETEQYYRDYLEKKPEDGVIHFAIGYIAMNRTGNYPLAVRSFERSLELLPEKDIYRRAKAYEYKGDIALDELEYGRAIEFFQEAVKYQERVREKIEKKQAELSRLQDNINELKTSLLQVEDFDKYEEYESLLDEKGFMETEIRKIENEYLKMNAGKLRWNMAMSYEKTEKLEKAIEYYRQAIAFDYQANDARDKIVKLQLKIKRGF